MAGEGDVADAHVLRASEGRGDHDLAVVWGLGGGCNFFV